MKLSIIIINYKSEELTVNFIKNELSKIQIAYDTIVVNNSATCDSNLKLAEELDGYIVNDIFEDISYHNVYIINNKENSGFAKGNNLGAKFADLHLKPHFILFTNTDIVIKDNYVVEALIDKLNNLNDVGIIGPKVVGVDGILQSPEPFFPFFDNFIWVYWSTFFMSKEKKRKRFRMDYKNEASEGYHYKVMGSFFLCKAKAFFDCSMMDPKTFLYAEENILTERMKRIGMHVYYYPDVSVIHAHGVTVKKHINRKKHRNLMFESNVYYYKTYIGLKWWEYFLGWLTNKILNLISK